MLFLRALLDTFANDLFSLGQGFLVSQYFKAVFEQKQLSARVPQILWLHGRLCYDGPCGKTTHKDIAVVPKNQVLAVPPFHYYPASKISLSR